MSLWIAIVLTLLGSSLTNLGVALLKKALAPSAGTETLRTGLTRPGGAPLWYLGWAALLVGFAIFLLATTARAAPISVLQPMSAFGLVVIALLAVFFLKERFGSLEWLGLFLLLLGVILLGLSAEPDPAFQPTVQIGRYLAFAAGAATLALGVAGLLQLPQEPRKVEVLFGILAGLLFGVGYLSTKALSLAWWEGRGGVVGLAVLGMAIGILGGLAVLLMGFRRGRALMLSAVNFVTNQVLVGTGSLMCLGENLPNDDLPFYIRISGLAAILIGILIFVSFKPAGDRS